MGTYNRKDHLYHQAKSDGLRSRGAYKLVELDQRCSMFRQGMSVLDLGSFPGGWLQVALDKVGKSGRVYGIDLRELEPVRCKGLEARVFHGDVLDEKIRAQLKEEIGSVDILLSDMSPSLSGVRFRDAARAAELLEVSLGIAGELLVPGGKFAAKIFPGSEADELFREMQKVFTKVRRLNLKSSRRTSTELYFVGLAYKGIQDSEIGHEPNKN